MFPYLLLSLSLAGAVGLILIVVAARARARARTERLRRGQELIWLRGDEAGGLATLEPLRGLAVWGPFAEAQRVYALRQLLRVDEAAEAVLAIRAELAKFEFPWDVHNSMVDTLVCAGRYEAALAVETEIPEPRRTQALAARDAHFGLVQINLAEAEVNLGRPEAALARLEGWDEGAAALPITASGLGLQRGWILGLLGRGEEAMAAVATMRREDLGPRFAAEYHLSRAFALMALARHEEADAEIAEALARAIRPSSTRNALFMRARVADARGDAELAERLCRDAAAHPHRWQGGDGLLFLGDLCARRGDLEAARAAWALAVERDPESVSAREAAGRLSEHAGGAAEAEAEAEPAAAEAAAAAKTSERAAPVPPPPLIIPWIDRVGASRPHLAAAIGLILGAASIGLVALTVGAEESRTMHTFMPRIPEQQGGAVHVLGGAFLMGSTLHDDERPTRIVAVKSFWLDRTEVSAAVYDACVRDGACTAGGALVGCTGGCGAHANEPINCVDYAQATAFCTWRGGRLPSEAEWEYAAKGGAEQRTYPWGAAEPDAQLCWRRKVEEGTCAIASFPAGASRDGALDLAGGVREWTSSPYSASAPSPPSAEEAKTRTIRGTAWDDADADWARSAHRSSQRPELAGPSVGFRCAYDAAPEYEAASTDD